SFVTVTEAYRPLFDLCWLLFEGLRPGEHAGSIRCPAFLLDMERVFERYLTDGIRRACADGPLRVAVQPLIAVNESAPRRPDLQMRPDILLLQERPPHPQPLSPETGARGEEKGSLASALGKGEQPLLVVDAKWKRLVRSPLVTEDVYQMLAYCAGLGVRRAVLVYPGRRDRRWGGALGRFPLTTGSPTLRVDASP